MRILSFNHNLDTISEIADYTYIDNIDDIEDLEYYVSIRQYDIVFINTQGYSYLKFLDTLKELQKRDNERVYKVYFMADSDFEKDKLLEAAKTRYNKVPLEEVHTIGDLRQKTIGFFHKTPELIKEFKVNHKQKTVKVIFQDNSEYEFKFKIDRDFKVMVHFIRHYGEVISISSLISSISDEPEFVNLSLVESTISTIRKAFKAVGMPQSIVAYKKLGYKIEMANT